MAHLVKKKRYLGCLWELETVTLPGGAPTTDFQHWRISFTAFGVTRLCKEEHKRVVQSEFVRLTQCNHSELPVHHKRHEPADFGWICFVFLVF